MRIAFLGLGQMGAAVAANLLRAGHELIVWNRSHDKTAPLTEAGAAAATTPREAVANAEAVFTMLADDAALQDVLGGDSGILAGLQKGALHISLSTIAVATADSAAAQHALHGQRYISAPVFGRPDAAAAGKLFVVTGGADADIDTAKPLLEAISQRIFHVGETPSSANLVKLCGNFMILSTIEALAEAMTLAEKGGVPKAKLLDVFTGSIFGSPIVQNYGKILVEERYRPAGFAAPLGLKDMRLAAQAADANRVPMPLLSLLRDHLLETIAKEGEDIDWSGIGLTVARNSGI